MNKTLPYEIAITFVILVILYGLSRWAVTWGELFFPPSVNPNLSSPLPVDPNTTKGAGD